MHGLQDREVPGELGISFTPTKGLSRGVSVGLHEILPTSLCWSETGVRSTGGSLHWRELYIEADIRN